MKQQIRSVAVGIALLMTAASTAGTAATGTLGNNPATFDQQIETAFLNRDVAFIDAVVAADARFTHDGGTVWNKQQWLDAVKIYPGGARDAGSVVVEQHGDVLETVGHIRRVNPDRSEQQIYYVRLYARRDGAWKFLSHRTFKMTRGPLSSE